MRLRGLSVALVAALALAAGACGGSDAGSGAEVGDSAGFVPANAPAYVYVNTDFESDAWKNLQTLLDKFPDREQALSELRESLSGEGVTLDELKAALGPETALAVLSFAGEGNALGLNEAKDQAKLDALIKKLDTAAGGEATQKEVVDGWTLVSDDQAPIEAAKRAHDGESLADSDQFNDAMGDLEGDAVLRFYVDGAAAARELDAQTQGAATSLAGGGTLQSIAGQVTAADNGLGFDIVTRTEGGEEPQTYASELVSQVPADVLLFASFNALGDQLTDVSSNPQLQQQLGAIQGALGISVTELAALFEREAALYVRQGSPFPEVTLALTVENEQRAMATIDGLANRLGAFAGGGAPTPQKIGDVDAKRLSIQNFAVYYAAFDGKLVLSSATTGISELSGGGAKLDDDETFKEAAESAGMPDETSGFLYVNIEDALPLLENFAQTAGEPLPSEARANAEPLRSALFYATGEQGKARVKGFLRVE